MRMILSELAENTVWESTGTASWKGQHFDGDVCTAWDFVG